MDITPYVESLRRDLQAAADAGAPDVRDAAQRLAFALDPSVRLMLMEALSQAASEITADLPAGSVDVRLNGRELEFCCQAEPITPPATPEQTTPEAVEEEDEDGAVARITLRLPESVKVKAEEAAADAGQSLNAWLVTVVRNATRVQAATNVLDLSSLPQIVNDALSAAEPFRNPKGNRRMTGWL